jgi:demethylspheroidene O-methyltransferase
VIADAWFDARNRLLGSPRFQRSASAFALTRPVARRHARALFDLCAGFVYSQVLLACVELRLFDRLASGPRGCAELARDMALPTAAAERLLRAAASLRLVQRRGAGRYGLGVLGAALRANPGVLAMVEHHRLLYADLADPVALLRAPRGGTAVSRYWAYARNDAAGELAAPAVSAYTALMAASQQLVADEVLDAWPLDAHRCLLDVGGGDGTFLARAAARAPSLRLMLFDLPAVADQARGRLAAAGLATRARVVGGDFRRDALPDGADVVSLVRVLHDHDDATALVVLRAALAALPVGGTVLVAEPFAGTRGAEAVGDAYFGLYLWAMGQGVARTPAELVALVRAAGFVDVRRHRTRTPLATGLLVARRPQASRAGVSAGVNKS